MKEQIKQHQELQELTWEIQEVIAHWTLIVSTKNRMIDLIKQVLMKYEDDSPICKKCNKLYNSDCDLCNWTGSF